MTEPDKELGHTYSQTHPLAGPMLHFDGDLEGVSLLEESRLQPVGRAAKTLVKEGPLRVTLLAFTAGSFLDDHQTRGSLVIQVLSGSVRVKGADDSVTLGRSGMAAIEPGVTHSIVALEDSVAVLLIAMPAS